MGQFVKNVGLLCYSDLQCGEFRPTPRAVAQVALGLYPPLIRFMQRTLSTICSTIFLLRASVMGVVRLSIRCHKGKRNKEREGNIATLSVSR
jgi:hypothetical protein